VSERIRAGPRFKRFPCSVFDGCKMFSLPRKMSSPTPG
jgi:hypothetical protein